MDITSLLVLFTLLTDMSTPYSIEKHIVDSATKAEMFDLFHVMPDGMMKLIHELDMLLSMDQYKRLYMDKRSGSSERYKRKAAADLSTRWYNCIIYYEITESLDTRPDRAIIKEAMDEWEKYSCLSFKESDRAKRRIQFTDGDMCASAVGMQNEPQPLILASGCRTKGIIAHEIGHAVGWFHEHMRPDRDDYINVHFSAIPSKYRPNYKKYRTDEVNTHKVPYDYTSIMHYGDAAFPGSIVARDPRFQSQMGQRDGFSFKDIKLANLMYKCAEIMKCPKRDCGDGFQFYKGFKGEKSCQCWCDSGNINDPLILCSRRKTTAPPPVVTLPPPTSEPEMECMDVRQDCKQLKKSGKCMSKMALMMANCAKTCGFCGKGKDLCMDYESGCGVMAGHCNDPGLRSIMSDICMATCERCNAPPNPCDIHKVMMGDEAGFSSNGVSTRHKNGVLNLILSIFVMVVSAFVMSNSDDN